MAISPEIQKILELHQYFFHVTFPANWEGIKVSGLCPKTAFDLNGDVYDMGAYANKPCVFLTTENGCNDAYRMKYDAMLPEEPIMLRIKAECVSPLHVDIDVTHHEIKTDVHELDWHDPAVFGEILAKHCYVVCFDAIPPECIELIQFEHPDADEPL